MEHNAFKKIAYFTLTAGVLVASQGVLAHSNTVTRTVEEGTTGYNAIAIGHGCGESAVIANSVVFPDGTDSTVSIDGAVVEGALVTDYIDGVPDIKHVLSKDVFSKSAIAHDRAGTSRGVHSWKGSVAAHDTIGLVPLRIGGVTFNEDSCAKSVRFDLAVADVCKITTIAGFSQPEAINFWTPIVEGSNFNRPDGENEASAFIVTRTSPLPETDANGNACGEGVDIRVTPSADQMNHDLPIPGVWPKAPHTHK